MSEPEPFDAITMLQDTLIDFMNFMVNSPALKNKEAVELHDILDKFSAGRQNCRQREHPMDEGGYVAAEKKIEEQKTQIAGMQAMLDAQARRIKEQNEIIHSSPTKEQMDNCVKRIESLVAENKQLRRDMNDSETDQKNRIAFHEEQDRELRGQYEKVFAEVNAFAKQNKEYEAQIRGMHLSQQESREGYIRKKESLINIISDLKANFDLT